MAKKQYRIEIWQHHVKIDEYEADTKKEINTWFNKNYALSEEWGECCHYIFNDGKDVDELKKEQKEAMNFELGKSNLTEEEKDIIIEALVRSVTTIRYEAAEYDPINGFRHYIGLPSCFTLENFRFDENTVLGQKLMRMVQERWKGR